MSAISAAISGKVVISFFFFTRDIYQYLRQGCHDLCQLGKPTFFSSHDGQDLKSRLDAIPGGVVVEEDEVARLLTAEVVAVLEHLLDHVAVTHCGLDDLAAGVSDGNIQPHIAHYRCHQGILLQLSSFQQVRGADGHDMVTVDLVAEFIHKNDPVRITIKGNSEIRAVGPALPR